jgi:diguanylate cyclase (GGDEF)-like protein
VNGTFTTPGSDAGTPRSSSVREPGTALARARPEWEAELRHAHRVIRLAHELANSLDPVLTARLVARGLASLVDATFAASYLVDERDELTLAGFAGPLQLEGLRRAPSVVGRALAWRSLVWGDDAELAELRALGAECGEVTAVPCTADGEVLAVLVVATPPGCQDDPQRRLTGTVADLAAASFANGRSFALTFAEARRDPLTGLPNHRAFDEHLAPRLSEAQAGGRAVSLVLFDLDDFKSVNDEHGHPVGDEILCAVSRVALRALRVGEEAFRLGGDEFAIVVQGDTAAAIRVVERVRRGLAKQHVGDVALPELSAGIAACPVDAPARAELVHRADVALYAAKRAGKNRIVSFRAHAAANGVERATARQEQPARAGTGDLVPELAALTATIAALGAEENPTAMLAAACRELCANLRAGACTISRLEEGILAPVASRWIEGSVPERLRVRRSLSSYPLARAVVDLRRPRAVSAADDDVGLREATMLSDLGMRSLLLVPIEVAGSVWGLAEIFGASPRRFGTIDLSIAALVASQTGVLLGQLQNAGTTGRLYRDTLASLSSVLEGTDGGAHGHTSEVARLAIAVGRRLGVRGNELQQLELAAMLHDVGNVRTPQRILQKAGPLTEVEWEAVRAHTQIGVSLLASIPALQPVLPAIRGSHERWDGYGYPDGLAGLAIPLGARIVAVCDAYQAMIEPRPYRRASQPADAARGLAAASATQFDPACVEALLAVLGVPPEARRTLGLDGREPARR